MGYTLPEYQSLCGLSAELLADFNTLSGRYITPNLNLLFDNTHKEMEAYVKTAGDRVSQAKALLQLVLELKSDENYIEAEGKKDKTDKDRIIIANTHQIMLGALIHRYLRITDEYRPVKKTTSMFGGFGEFVTKAVYNPVPTNSDIYNAIGGILNITVKNKLDPMTIKTSCECFKNYMLQSNRYLTYMHYKDDPHFEIYLQGFIDKAAKGAESIIPQIRQIQFLMSLTKNIQGIHNQVSILLQVLEKRMTDKDMLPLNISIIQNRLKDVLMPEDIKARFCLLLDRQDVFDNIHKWSVADFMTEMRQALDINSQYALFGGYYVIFSQITKQQPFLHRTMSRALKCDKPGNAIDSASAAMGLKCLKNWFMKINIDNASVDWSLLDGKDIGKDLFFAQYKLTKMNLSTTNATSCPTKATI